MQPASTSSSDGFITAQIALPESHDQDTSADLGMADDEVSTGTVVNEELELARVRGEGRVRAASNSTFHQICQVCRT